MKQFQCILVSQNHAMTVNFGEASPEQLMGCRKLASAEFGKHLSEEDYLEHEHYLDQKPLVRDNGWRTWCLSSAHDANEVLATCKTIPREILIRDASGVSRQKAYCIASVVTSPLYRGHGLASRLLECVAEWLDGLSNAGASMLYTSIGDFYHRRGWKMMHTSQVSFSWPATFVLPTSQDQLPETRRLSNMDIPMLCNRDVEDMEFCFEKLTPQPSETHLCVLPTAHLVTWLHDRSDIVCTKSRGIAPQSHGSICESADTWLYWFHDIRKQQLAIQRVHMPGKPNPSQSEALIALLLDAIAEARAWDLSRVVLWNPSAELLAASSTLSKKFGIEPEMTQEHNKSVPSLRWRHSDQTNTTVFHFNEFYNWS